MNYKKCLGEEGDYIVRYEIVLDEDEARRRLEEIYVFLAMQTGVDYVANQPRAALHKRYGADIESRVADCLANQCIDEVIEAEDIAAALEPVVKSCTEEIGSDGFTCVVDVYVKPQLELSSYEPVEIMLSEPEVTDEMVEKEMLGMVERYARYVDSAASVCNAETCNVITIDTKKLGMRVSPLTADHIMHKVGEGTFPEQVDEALFGMHVGETKEFQFVVTSKNFLGLEVDEAMDCVLTLEKIVERETPVIDDEWVAKHIPGAHSVESFRELVRRNLLNLAMSDFMRIKDELACSELAKRLPEIDLPEEFYEYARAGLMQNITAALARQGMSVEEMLTAQGVDHNQFMLQMMVRARSIVRHGLALDSFSRHEGLVPGTEDMSRAVLAISPGNESETSKMLKMNGRSYQLREMASRLKARAVIVDGALLTK